jgi:RNA polymerase sigma factor (TIGR02999 family)
VEAQVNLTDLIHRAQAGDPQAADALFSATYGELRKLARARLHGGRRDVLLDTTALVHEWYLRFPGTHGLQLQDRAHFMRYAGRAMRSVIVDYVRERLADRRGGGAPHVDLTLQLGDRVATGEDEILRVHQAIDDLAKLDGRMAQVVEMRYFGGLSEIEIADALGVTDRTVRRDWEKARLLLAQALE